MAYTPTTWTTGDTITASAMNKIEQGIANSGGALVCNTSYNFSIGKHVLDKTVQEIYDALLSGTPAYIKFQYGTMADYSGTLYLAPIIRISNYIYTEDIKIYANRPVDRQVSNVGTAGAPSILVYSATGLNEYPVFDTTRTTSVSPTSLVNNVNVL